MTLARFALVFLLFGCAVAQAQTSPQPALTTQSTLNLALSQEAANAAYAQCVADGQHASVAVVDDAGLTKVILAGDGSSPLTPELARQKAYTSAMMQRTSAEYVDMWNARPNAPPMGPGLVPYAGGVPIAKGTAIVGAIGVSGGRGAGGGAEE